MKNDQDLSQFLQIASNAALEGGKILEKYWGKLKKIEEKGFSGDLVTEADKESEEVIIRYILKHCPDHTILSEETGLREKKDSEYSWIIDPLDGTTNYTHQYPLFAVSIAVVRSGKPIAGVVYNPHYKEMFTAALGSGAFLNGEPIKVSKVHSIKKALLATGFAYDRQETNDNNYREFCYLTHYTQGVRRDGSAALDLAYVAAGRLDGFWERGLKPWDIAAGTLLVEEAGGKATSYEGEALLMESGRILSSNSLIHKDLINLLEKARQKTAWTC